jgi:twitching motility protein PilT
LARRRRRRVGESAEGVEDSLLDDDDDELDIRVAAIEEAIQKITVDTQETLRDQRALRAKLDKLAREFEEGAEGDDELFQELDQFKQGTTSQFEHLNEAVTVLTDRIAELTARLDNVSGDGPLESLPQRMEELIAKVHQQVSQRFDSLEAAREEEVDLVAGRLEELTNSLETQAASLRGELNSALQDQSKLNDLSQDFQARLQSLTGDFEAGLGQVTTRLESALADTAQQQAAQKGELEATLAELADALDSRAGMDEVQELRSELERVLEKFSAQSELGQRANQAMGKVEQLESTLQQNSDRYEQLLQRAQTLASETEKYSDKVDLAVRLVRALEEKGRGGAPAELNGGAAVSSVSVSESDLEAPEKTDLGFGLRDLLNVMATNQASDLHIKVGSTPMVRLHGDLIPVGNHSLGEEDCRRLLFTALSKEERRRLLQNRSLDFIYEQPGLRLRGHAFYQRNRLCGSLRMLRSQMPTLEELGLPAVLRRTVGQLKHGVVLITGPLGSGKSTTLAALVDELNRTRKLHILTLESPINFIHQDQQALITQREFGTDFHDPVRAIHDGLKHDPDAIVVDPLGNADTAVTALAAGDSGHLILASIEAPNLLSGLDRMLSFCNSHGHVCDRRQVAYNLRAVVSQRLLPRADKSKGLVPAAEVLLVNSHISQLLAEGQLDQLSQAVQKGQAGEGSQSMSQSLSRLVEAGLIQESEASSLLPPTGSTNATTGEADDAPIMRWL